jgi:hypothetical protein
MHVRVRLQLAEALGPDNRWYCSQAHGRPVDDPELLLRHFVRSGGAADFARRFTEALSHSNRWFCSEFYGREIHDEEVLWSYYVRSTRLAGDQAWGRRDRCTTPLTPAAAAELAFSH